MDKIFLIIKREYLVNVKKKSFLIMTFLAPFLTVLFLAVVVYIGQANNMKKNIAVIDESGLFQNKLHNTEYLAFDFFDSKEAMNLKDSVFNTETVNLLIEIPSAKDSLFSNLDQEISLIVKNDVDIHTKEYLTKTFREILEEKRLEVLGISPDHLQQSKSKINFNILSLASNQTGDASLIKLSLASGLAYVVFMFIMIYGVRVMRSVIEEKNSRVVEVIVSSVKPMQLMIGKILGIALVALTQFVIWIALTLFLMLIYQSLTLNNIESVQTLQEGINKIPNPDSLNQIIEVLFHLNYPFIIVTFLVFFTLGYLFFSSFFAAIGSAVDNETETQQFTFLAIAPLMIGGYGSFTSLMTNPEGHVLAVLSVFPMTSPVAMVIRSPYEVPVWQWILAIVLLAGATVGMIYIAAKIYRTGILMYGKKASFKELYKWLKY
ncbi:MAG: ABC transporter permease [Flavobacteriales bacterium]